METYGSCRLFVAVLVDFLLPAQQQKVDFDGSVDGTLGFFYEQLRPNKNNNNNNNNKMSSDMESVPDPKICKCNDTKKTLYISVYCHL